MDDLDVGTDLPGYLDSAVHGMAVHQDHLVQACW
jgi:hypothetical protein